MFQENRRIVFLTLLFSLGISPLAAKALPPWELKPHTKITRNAVIKPGVYRVEDDGAGAVQISGSDFTVDFSKVKLLGAGKSVGVGLHITDAHNVTIRHADVSGYLWGVVIERSSGVKLVDCVTSRNADLPAGTVIDESGKEPEDTHGGGIVIRDSRNCMVQRCRSQYQWDGIDVVRSAGNVIEDGDFSFNGNWGLHLWNSSRNVFRRNRAVWCTTGEGTLFQALTGWQTYDSQAVGIDHNSNENTIEDNDLRFGGDAIFIRANEGPITPGTVVPPLNGSHRNILRGNDCSFSPNNAIEVDLVDDTVIENNNCSNSNYGMWLGYSRRCIVRGNTCINDSSHAVEIENGQDDLFENNVFGFDTRRSQGQLVYLRQNGRDKTRSGGYIFRGNVFYGAGTGLELKATQATLTGNTMVPLSDTSQVVTHADAASQFDEKATQQGVPDFAPRPPYILPTPAQKSLRLNALVTLKVPGVKPKTAPPVVEIAGIPVWVRSVETEAVTFWMPADFWDRPAPTKAEIRVRRIGLTSEALVLPIAWPAGMSRIASLSPNPARIGDPLVLTGANLKGGRILLNGIPTESDTTNPNSISAKLPGSILVPTRYNVLWEKGTGEHQERTWPITLTVTIPPAQLPHLISAEFSPKTLKVGELLKVTMTVRNNLPAPAPLTMRPAPPFTYDEKQASYEMGYEEAPGKLHLRVSTDFEVGGHNPGSWPWLFGFDKPTLAPSETVTVVGYVRVETPGVHEFRIGLVAGGFRFIDDNAYRTKITVLP
ncbi:MAG: putative pectin lyase [Chthonomonadaceae bacterium]|nr:putative pectin lyase [Chthonomonadaceae bacterium]